MTNISENPARQYYVTQKTICPECNGAGSSTQVFISEPAAIHSTRPTIKNYPNARGERNSTCFVCDGTGKIRNDVQLSTALRHLKKG